MSISPAQRAAVRTRFAGRCGYCGMPETMVGNELEIDHFRPHAHGGDDSPDNLVYACTACNRYKSAYWPGDHAPEDICLLHPMVDNVDDHIVETISGHLVGLTARGWFHIRWLHLNRPLLISFRQLRQREQVQIEAISQAQETTIALQHRIETLERELADLRAWIMRLVSSEAQE